MLPDATRLRMETTTAANSTHLGQYGCRQTRSLRAYPGATPTQRNPGLAGLFESRMRLYGLRSNPEPQERSRTASIALDLLSARR